MKSIINGEIQKEEVKPSKVNQERRFRKEERSEGISSGIFITIPC